MVELKAHSSSPTKEERRDTFLQVKFADPVKKREQFAVSLRKKKQQEIISSKRRRVPATTAAQKEIREKNLEAYLGFPGPLTDELFRQEVSRISPSLLSFGPGLLQFKTACERI